MVKKLLLVIILSLIMGVSLIPSKVNAEVWNPYDGIEWEFYNFYSTYYGIRGTVEIPTGVSRVWVTLPDVDNNVVFTAGGIDSSFIFNTLPADTEIAIYDLYQGSPPTYPSGDFMMTLANVDGNDVSDATEMTIIIMSPYTVPPAQFMATWIDTCIIRFPDILRVNFWVAGTLYDTQYILVTSLPTNPGAPPDIGDAEFIYWRTITGDKLNFFTSNVLQEYLLDGVLNYYGVFAGLNDGGYVAPEEPNTTNTPDAIIDLFDAVGMANPAGYIFSFIVLIIIISFLLLKFGAGAFVVVVIDMVVFGFYIFMGLLPVYAIIIVVMLFVFAILYSLNSGGGVTSE